jgi:hypothetical protein
MHRGPAPTLLKGETPQAAVARVRKKITDLRASITRVQAAPLPRAVIKERMRKEVTELAVRGTPNIDLGNGDISWRQTNTQLIVYLKTGKAIDGLAGGNTLDSLALFAWPHRDALIARFEEEIEATADDASALTDTQRKKQEQALLDQILIAEREECALIEMAAAEGTMIAYRPDTSPVAVVGLASRGVDFRNTRNGTPGRSACTPVIRCRHAQN